MNLNGVKAYFVGQFEGPTGKFENIKRQFEPQNVRKTQFLQRYSNGFK